MDSMAAIRDTFFQECAEQLAEIEVGLDAIDLGEANAEIVNAVFRAVHSIKGGAGAFHLDRLVQFAHAFETTLDSLRSGKITPTDSLIKTMFRSKDALSDLVEYSRAGGDIDEHRIETLIEELKATVGGDSAPPGGDMSELDFQPLTLSLDDLAPPGADPLDVDQHYVITFTPRRELYRKGNEPARLLRELGQLGEIEAVCDATALPGLEELDPEGAYLAWRIDLKTDKPLDAIEEVFDFVVDDCELAIVPQDRTLEAVDEEPAQAPEAAAPEGSVAPDAPALADPSVPPSIAAPETTRRNAEKPANDAARPEAAAATPTIRVDLDRVDRLINLVGELVINQAMLSQKVTEAGIVRSSRNRLRSRRSRATDTRNPGRRDGNSRPAGEAVVPAHGAHRAGTGRGDWKVGALADGGRGYGSRSNGHRAPCRSPRLT